MRKDDKFSEDIQLKGFCLKKAIFFRNSFIKYSTKFPTKNLLLSQFTEISKNKEISI